MVKLNLGEIVKDFTQFAQKNKLGGREWNLSSFIQTIM